MYNRICFELSTFLDSPRMRRWVSFHGLLRPETEFQHHLPVFLRIHTLPAKTCIWRTAGRYCQNSVSDRSRAWKGMETNLIYTSSGGIMTYPHLLDSRNTM
jgi:hypothetical protein